MELVPGQPTPDRDDVECQVWVFGRKFQKVRDVLVDLPELEGMKVGVLGGNRLGLTLEPYTLAVDGSVFLTSFEGRTLPVTSG